MGEAASHDPIMHEAAFSVDPSDASLWKPPELVFDVQVLADASKQLLWNSRFKQHHYLSQKLGTTIGGGSFVAVERATRKLAAFHSSNMLPGAKTFVREC